MASARTLPRPPSNSSNAGPKISMPSMKVSPKQIPISMAWAASVDARSTSPAPSARATAEATPPPIAPPDIGGLGDDHAGAGAERDHVGPGQPQQRAQNRAVDLRVSYRRLGRRKRTLVLIDRYFGDADIRHFSPLGRDLAAAPSPLPSTVKADSTCIRRNGPVRDCRRLPTTRI